MSLRFSRILDRLRLLALQAFYVAGLLFFWLPANEAFEGPKTQAALFYAGFMLALAWPLRARLAPLLARRRPWVWTGGFLLATTALSLVGAALALPSNMLLPLERSAPLLASGLAALVWALETSAARRKLLWTVLVAHLVLIFYGLFQFLDQTLGRQLGLPLDMVRWTSFGEVRVYSCLGNPDYFSAHLTLLLPLLAVLGPKGWDLRGGFKTAAWTMLLLPVVLILLLYGGQPSVVVAFAKVYLFWGALGGLFVWAGRKAPLRWLWLSLLYCVVGLIIVAQGRGAYLGLLLSAVVGTLLVWRVLGWESLKAQRSLLLANGLALGLGLLGLLGALGLRVVAPEHALLKVGPVASTLKISDAVSTRIRTLGDRQSDTWVVRLFYWRAAADLGWSHPLFGVGFGNHAMFTARAQSEVWKRWESAGDRRVALVEPHVELYAHNDPLQNFAETGLLGLAAFMAFWGYFGWGAWQLLSSAHSADQARRRVLGIGFMGLVLAFGVSSLTNFPWRVLATQQWAWLCFAWLALESGDQGLDLSLEPAVTPPHDRWSLFMGVVLAGVVSATPLAWFASSNLAKVANVYKDTNQSPATAINFYEKARAFGFSGTQRVELTLYLGSMYNLIGRDDLAEAEFKKGIEIYPDFIEAWYNLGYTYTTRHARTHAQADQDLAQAAFEKVLDINPRYANALNNLGNIYYSRGQFTQAAQFYKRLTKYLPHQVEGHYNLGAVAVMLGDKEQALQSFDAALALQPEHPQAKAYAQQLRKLPKAMGIKAK